MRTLKPDKINKKQKMYFCQKTLERCKTHVQHKHAFPLSGVIVIHRYCMIPS